MDIDQLRALVAVSEAGSLAGAARASGMSRTTLRRRLVALGDALDAAVVVSDGRDVAITPIGARVVAQARELIRQAEALQEDVHAAMHDAAGSLCILVPPSIHPLAAVVVGQAARARFPDLAFDLRYVEDPVTHLDAEGDLALHWGPLASSGARIARRLRSAPLRLLASHAYVDARGVPLTLDDLAQHDLFTYDGGGLRGDALPLLDGGSWPVRPTGRTTNVVVHTEIARLGGGIALVPDVRLPGDGWPEEDVVRVLPDVVGHDMPQWVVGREQLSRRTALVALMEEIAALMEGVAAPPGRPSTTRDPA